MENPVELAARTLSAEIHHVFSTVEEILPELSDYSLGAKDPKWMPLERGSDKTIRDYILQFYSAEQLGQPTQSIKAAALICPLSFDITSNARTFEIDHFYPKDDILQALRHLESNQTLLLETKKQLELLFSKSHGVKAIEIVNKLIPEIEQKLFVTGLRHIYYNYPKNLWPISGPTNSSKGKKASLKFAIEKIFESLLLFPGEPVVGRMLSETAISVGLTHDSELPRLEKIDAISDALVSRFDTISHESEFAEAAYILPSYYSPTDSKFVSMLEFFQKSPVGDLAINYSKAIAQQTLRAMRFAKTIAISLMSPDPTEQSLAIGFAAASKTVDRAARRQLGTEDVSSDSDNSLDETSKQAMRFSAAEITRMVEKADAISTGHEEEGDQNPVKKAKKELCEMKECGIEKDLSQVHQDESDDVEDNTVESSANGNTIN